MKDDSPKEDQYRSQFRLPYSLYDQLKSAADAEKRSVNAEIVLRLEASFVAAEDPVARLLPILEERDRRLIDELRAALGDFAKARRPK